MSDFETLADSIGEQLDALLEQSEDKREALTDIESVLSDLLLYYLALDGYEHMQLDKKDFQAFLNDYVKELKINALEYFEDLQTEDSFADDVEDEG